MPGFLDLVTKFNPYHDERGRFTSGDSHEAIMGSPNTTRNQSLGDALKQMEGNEVRGYIAQAKGIEKQYGFAGHFEKAIGLWDGQMEAAVIEHVHGKVAADTIAAAAATLGKSQHQDAMATWVDDPDGQHNLTTIHLPKGIDATPQYLVDNGVPAATVTPGPNGTTNVSIISTEPNKEEMAHLASRLGSTSMEVKYGHADFIDKANYDSIIGSYQRSHSHKYDGGKRRGGTYPTLDKTPPQVRAKRLGAFSYR